MKKTSASTRRRRPEAADPDEIRSEYDWSKATRNPYARRFAQGSNIVVLEPDVAALFPNSASVNEALRSLASVIGGSKRKRSAKRRTA